MMEKMKMSLPEPVPMENIALLSATLFPACSDEGPGEDGLVRLAVDFDSCGRSYPSPS
jgi:hypothetical protein